MKKTSIILGLAAMLVAMVSCTKEEQPVSGQFTMTVNADKGTRATKGLSLDGTTLSAVWAVGERVTVYNETKSAPLEGYLEVQNPGGTTQLKGDLTGTVEVGDRLTLKFLSGNYGSQDGTLAYIAANCDYATANITIRGISGGSVTTTDAVFQNQQAIIKFTLTDKNDAAITPSALTVSDGTSTVSLTGIPAATYTTNGGDGVLYVAFPAAGEAKTITLTANVGVNYYDYTFEKTGVTFTNGQYYTISVKMSNRIVHLDLLGASLTAQDGDILTGTLNGETQPYKINVNTDGATVTLRDATISGYNESTVRWAGITCENNTTLVIEGTNSVTGFNNYYPGIHIASDKTLTIQGTTGTLNVSSNGYGAGIGGGPEIPCGNIVIESGTINATGGMYEAGIGGGYSANCGSITINGGNVAATGGKGAAGIGTGLSQVNITGGGISITGGEVTANGGIGAAGIGSGFAGYGGDVLTNKCGNISITGGQVTATGGNGGSSAYNDLGVSYSTYYGGAGIGTGSTNKNNSKSSCGTITIGNGARVTAYKGGGTNPATNSIGKNESTMNQGTCGTITIGDVVTGNISTSPYTYPQP